jgi:hypothetical protein
MGQRHETCSCRLDGIHPTNRVKVFARLIIKLAGQRTTAIRTVDQDGYSFYHHQAGRLRQMLSGPSRWAELAVKVGIFRPKNLPRLPSNY